MTDFIRASQHPGPHAAPASRPLVPLNTRFWLLSMSNRVSGDEWNSEVVLRELGYAQVPAAVYPVARSGGGGDARFTYGLALDVAAALARHGFPPVRAGAHLVRVQQALFELIYGAG